MKLNAAWTCSLFGWILLAAGFSEIATTVGIVGVCFAIAYVMEKPRG